MADQQQNRYIFCGEFVFRLSKMFKEVTVIMRIILTAEVPG